MDKCCVCNPTRWLCLVQCWSTAGGGLHCSGWVFSQSYNDTGHCWTYTINNLLNYILHLLRSSFTVVKSDTFHHNACTKKYSATICKSHKSIFFLPCTEISQISNIICYCKWWYIQSPCSSLFLRVSESLRCFIPHHVTELLLVNLVNC